MPGDAGTGQQAGASNVRAAAVALLCVLALALLAPLPASAQTSASRFYIEGAGFGHGVGMSAYGAAGFAAHGYDYGQILAHYYTGVSLATVPASTQVTVLLGTGAAAFRGGAAIAGSKTTLTAAFRYTVVPNGAKLELLSAGHKVGVFNAPLSVSGPTGQPLTLIGSGRYWGSFVFRVVGGAVQTVNELPVDQYADGVISKEMVPSWPIASLQAFADAIRSVALANPVAPGDYDVYADTRSQVYGGVNGETASGDQAVSSTSDQVIQYHGQTIMAYYFASSGGYTESIQNVWAGSTPEPYLTAVSDPYDDSFENPYYRWSRVIGLQRAASVLAGRFRGTLRGIVVLSEGVSPRIVSARVVGSRGSSVISGATLRQIFNLDSTYVGFTTISEHAVRFRTANHGYLRALAGTVFPAKSGSPVTVQQWVGGHFSTLASGTLGSAGGFEFLLAKPGTYRIVGGGLTGPSVNVS